MSYPGDGQAIAGAPALGQSNRTFALRVALNVAPSAAYRDRFSSATPNS